MNSALRAWLKALPHTRLVSLFDAGQDLVVNHRINRNGRKLLLRSPAMEQAMIDVVESGLPERNWLGVLYIMGWGRLEDFRPLYIGKAGKKGRKNNLSANLTNIRTNKNKFARWGDGRAYHMGTLSQVIFGWDAYIAPENKYMTWSRMLFEDPSLPRLREPTNLLIIPWWKSSKGPKSQPVSLEEAEAETIAIALDEFEDVVLNVEGEVWWRPEASTSARPPNAMRPRNPFKLVASSSALSEVCLELKKETAIGLDVETTLYRQRLCLVQVAGRRFTAVIDALAWSDLAPLKPLLESEGPLKIIHNASFERRVLGERGIDVAPVFDTLRSSRTLRGRYRKHRLDLVCERELGRILDKSCQTSRWQSRPLSRAQLEYAALDAEVLLDLYDVFRREQPELPF